MTAAAGAARARAGAGAIIEARGLGKWFGEVVALNGVDFEIGPGITGILGPNGAGKSTLMNLATGQLWPSKGTITVFGEGVRNNLRVLGRMGYLPDLDRFWAGTNGFDFVARLAALSGMSRAEAGRAADRVIERVGLAGRKLDPVETYSRGMRQRIKLAQALVHDPELLLLDEPLTGLDPVARQETVALLRGLAGEGRTIVISSHVLHEIEALAREVILLVGGRVIASGSIPEIRGHLERHPHTIVCRSAEARRIAAEVIGTSGLMALELADDDRVVTVRTRNRAAVTEAIHEAVLAGRVSVEAMAAADDGLEAVFRYLVR